MMMPRARAYAAANVVQRDRDVAHCAASSRADQRADLLEIDVLIVLAAAALVAGVKIGSGSFGLLQARRQRMPQIAPVDW